VCELCRHDMLPAQEQFIGHFACEKSRNKCRHTGAE
jgi:hypothetical protein